MSTAGAGSGRDPHRVLEVDPAARPEVIEAAFRVLRELACRDPGEGAARRLAELTWAHRELTAPERRRRPGPPPPPPGSPG